MSFEYIPFGEAFSDLCSDNLTQVSAKKTLALCQTSKDFEVLELRRLVTDDGKIADIIIVDCVNEEVPSHSQLGIKNRERLALVFMPDKLPEVRAVRKEFPSVPHQNHVPSGQPCSLCLYSEPWSAVERTWTPQHFLQRVLWWLSETAEGRLHRDDQAVERVYFDSPYEIVLPPDFDLKINNEKYSLILIPAKQSTGEFKVLRGLFLPNDQAKAHEIPQTEVLMLELTPVMHGDVEHYPNTLGQLHDQLENRGAPFIDGLNALIRERAEGSGLTRNSSNHCLLVLTIPVKRRMDAAPETYEVRAFHLFKDIATLGEATGTLTYLDGKLYAIKVVGDSKKSEITKWCELEVSLIDVRYEVDKFFARRASGVFDETADFKGVLAGVGALGSAMVELWSKESWGEWTLMDPDIVKAHNIVRHTTKNSHIGQFKVDAVKNMVEANYHDGYYSVNVIPDSAQNWDNALIRESITTAALMVDATTTLEVPRDLSQRDDVPRSVSVFLSPSGRDSALLMESADRSVRLDSLEAQYYRAIINTGWGATHLEGHQGMLWVGAGCRDRSAIMSNEDIQLHAAILAKQIRLLRDRPEPCIRVWSADPETDGLAVHNIPVQEMKVSNKAEWRVSWDRGLEEKLCETRHRHLPSETGGIVLGYIDQKLKTIYVVDALEAPADSEADRTGFTRGVEGLEAALDKAARRTGNIVGYIGEWHSHPAFSTAYPSSLDRALIDKLASILASEGQPALMVIVGSAGDITFTVKDE